MTIHADERHEIEALLRTYPTPRSVALEALKIIQQAKKWITDEDIRDVAALLEMTPAELDSLATFYSQIFRRPVGEHVIRLCDGVSCWIMGETGLEERLSHLLGIGPGETTSDRCFTWLPVSCLGVCEQAPAIMIDDDLYTHLKPEDLDVIVERYVQRGAEK
jgi:NADH-quinone oxidoreductase subunit E